MAHSIVSAFSDNTNKSSLSHRMRFGRHQFFLSCLEQLRQKRTGYIRILDIGGTKEYWQSMGFSAPDVRISLLNLGPAAGPLEPYMDSLVGDAKDLSDIPDQSYDLVFSNSVIEHLFSLNNQKAMAKEVQRVGKNYFIQTPNYWFPIEPHWVFPFFQYLPRSIRVLLTQSGSWGHIGQQKDLDSAKKQVDEVRLMTQAELANCFPGCRFYAEKWGGMNKSWIAHNF
ncbi:MAG: class I SAM-dependent methyltransferase [Sphingobacteriia bacterium]|nr:MAG: class I SAM-dependent methyltransferase [Sphingobacteriia bacterium]